METTFVESISNGGLFTLPNSSKLKFYFIEPMKHRPVEMLGDAKWDKLSIRLLTAFVFGSASDKIVEVDPMEQSFRDMLGSITGYLLKKYRIESGHKLPSLSR